MKKSSKKRITINGISNKKELDILNRAKKGTYVGPFKSMKELIATLHKD